MSDYTITGAVASNNLTDPLKLSKPLSLDIIVAADVTVTLTITGTIAFPATITAERIGTQADVILWDSIVTDTLTAPPVEFSVTAQTTPVVQELGLVSQNYLVTITDNDARTQTFNVAIDNTDGYPTACLGPTVSAILPAAPVLSPLSEEGGESAITPGDESDEVDHTLTWTTPDPGSGTITGYKIEQLEESDLSTFWFTGPPPDEDPDPNNAGWAVFVADTGTTATTFVITDVTFCDDLRWFRISAITDVGTGPASNIEGFLVACP